ncbi:site-specific integrase [Candidatus Enterovibrio escicola]|uniref:site-specific integrase n=1 Tax=Candidatus Enterovibrio escicola TaxID=1927127 RepID=UPI001238212C|nr:site-specific integrase [Candidatus Enterovibrio escacola]
MALPPLIDKAQRDWLFKITRELSKHPERDTCLLAFFLGTQLSTLEINRLLLKDVLHKSGKLNKHFLIRGKKDYHGDDRYYYLANKKINGLIESYLDYRVKNKVCLGDNPDQYRSLDPNEAFFISYQGIGFSLVRKGDNYACDALNRHIKQLLKQSGIEQPSVLSGKRTFAVNLYQQGCDIAHLMHMLGDRSIETTKRLVETNPVDMAAISARSF